MADETKQSVVQVPAGAVVEVPAVDNSKLSVEDRITRLEGVVRQHFGTHTIPPDVEKEDDLQAETQAGQAARRGRTRPGPQQN